MASNSKPRRAVPSQDLFRQREAVREIAASANLRFFMRNLLGQAGLFELIPSTNALDMARFAGRHELGQSILATLNEVDPTLYPTLLLEEHHELSNLARAQNASAPSPEGGEPRNAAGRASGANDTAYE